MAAGARDFTTLADLKAWIPVTGTSEDTMLQNLLTNISIWIEQWLSRSIFKATFTDWRDGTGTDTMVMEQWPIVSVTSVEVNGVAVPLASSPTADGYYFTDLKIGMRGSYRFTRGVNNVKIVYVAGYATPSDPATVPDDLVQSCLELCSLRYKERPFQGVGSKNLGGEQTTFTQKDMPASVLSLLNNYKRRVPL